MNIIIGADIVPTESNVKQFMEERMDSLIDSELMYLLKQANYRIFNLEIPLTDAGDPIVKQGPNLIAPTDSVRGYQALGIDLLTLANNHILDQGVKGLESTINALNEAHIAYLGAGGNLNVAKRPYCFDFSDKKVGVYACAEHEFSIATEETAGANPFDPLWSLDHVEELSKNTDYVIVLYHGGKEHYRYPSPNLQKVCHRFVDKGANLVICQHSHCIGCEEKYKDGTIVYGQGNFLFDDEDSEFWQTSLLISIDESFMVNYIPLRKNGNGVCLAKDKDRILSEFETRGEEIKKPSFIINQYQQFADEYLINYLHKLSGKESVAFRVINKLTCGRLRRMRLEHLYDKKQIIAMINYVECEAHRELLLTGMKKWQDAVERQY